MSLRGVVEGAVSSQVENAPGVPVQAFDHGGRFFVEAVAHVEAAARQEIGDPPGFRLGECATQRQLSETGREQAQRIGTWFSARGLAPAEVRSSAWCRCLDTATLAFGRAQPTRG